MKTLRKLYFKLFKRYRVLETKQVEWQEAETMIINTRFSPENEKWIYAKEMYDKETYANHDYCVMYLCRKERIVE